jgi:hypothetical protein
MRPVPFLIFWFWSRKYRQDLAMIAIVLPGPRPILKVTRVIALLTSPTVLIN